MFSSYKVVGSIKFVSKVLIFRWNLQTGSYKVKKKKIILKGKMIYQFNEIVKFWLTLTEWLKTVCKFQFIMEYSKDFVLTNYKL